MKIKLLVAGMVLLTMVYVFGLAQRALVLLLDPSLFAKTFGLLLVLFPALAVWSIWSEINFGMRCESLARMLQLEDFPEIQVEVRPSGRPEPDSAAKVAADLRDQARNDPNNWRVWFRLSEALDAAGDRKSARKAAQTAIRMQRAG